MNIQWPGVCDDGKERGGRNRKKRNSGPRGGERLVGYQPSSSLPQSRARVTCQRNRRLGAPQSLHHSDSTRTSAPLPRLPTTHLITIYCRVSRSRASWSTQSQIVIEIHAVLDFVCGCATHHWNSGIRDTCLSCKKISNSNDARHQQRTRSRGSGTIAQPTKKDDKKIPFL